jgi:hypothetical protein
MWVVSQVAHVVLDVKRPHLEKEKGEVLGTMVNSKQHKATYGYPWRIPSKPEAVLDPCVTMYRCKNRDFVSWAYSVLTSRT